MFNKDDPNKISGLRTRIKSWILQVIVLARKIPKDEVGRVFINQLLRSATSVGANYEEASETQTTKDLIYKLALCLKEAKEAKYWIGLVISIYPSLEKECNIVLQEVQELIKIFSSIISKKKIES